MAASDVYKRQKEVDLHGSAQSIIRLQDVYDLDIRDLARGDIGLGRNRFMTNAELTAQVNK